ncbi:MAG: hypothetical protein V1820_06275 [archaeon]
MSFAEKVFKIAPSELDKAKSELLEKDDFKTQGYFLKSAKALNLKGEDYFLIVSAPIEFFLKNAENLKPYPEVEGDEGAQIITAVKDQEKAAEAGFGLVMS